MTPGDESDVARRGYDALFWARRQP
jgi:hypothetical protein